MINELVKTDIKSKLEPPARWYNWWRVRIRDCTITCDKCGKVQNTNQGEIIIGCCVSFPSKEVAEIYAARYSPNTIADYVGAYKEGERP